MTADFLEDLSPEEVGGPGAYETTTDLRYEHDGVTVVVTGVPAIFSPEIGEDLIPGPIGVILGDLVSKLMELSQTVHQHDDDDPVVTEIAFPRRYRETALT